MQRRIIKVNFNRAHLDYVADQLENVKWKDNGSFTALCPAHDDNQNSLSVAEGERGKILYHCHAGCTFEDVVACIDDIEPRSAKARKPKTKVVNNALKQLRFVRSEKNGPDFERLCGGQPQHVYAYRDQQDRLIGYVVRFEDKRFHQITPWQKANGRTVWRVKDFSHPRPLYGLEDLGASDDEPVLVVEGEKAADAAADLFDDRIVLSWHGGVNAVDRTDWSALKGLDVTIWPDADEAGAKAAQSITKHLLNMANEPPKIVELPTNLPKGWDLADLIPDDMDIHALVKNAQPAKGDLSAYLLSATALAKRKITPREMIVAPWMATQSVGLVFAKRGLGKTWFGITLAKAIALGRPFLGYEVPKPRRVLFVDGEMPLADLQERFKAVGADKIDNIDILASEIMYQEFHPLNINREEDRNLISSMLDRLTQQGRRPELLIFDNLSSLRMGVEENDNSALDQILVWLMSLRHKGYSTLIVHHAGKTGEQRGASRLEDLLDTTIKLEPSETATNEVASFDLSFTKTRGQRPDPDQMTLKLEQEENGILDWQYSASHSITPRDHTLYAIYMGPDEDGRKSFQKQKDLMTVLELQAGAISKHLTFLRKDNLVEATKDAIKVTNEGKSRLKAVFPDETF
jgi:KaiC/GvpD/RAD55 family RecA-like ATPase